MSKATIINTTDGSSVVKFNDGSSFIAGSFEEAKSILGNTYSEYVSKDYSMSTAELIQSHEERYKVSSSISSGDSGFATRFQNKTDYVPERPQELSFDPANAVRRSGVLGFDKASYVVLSDGSRVSTKAGSGQQEVLNAIKLAEDKVNKRNSAISYWDQRFGSSKEKTLQVEPPQVEKKPKTYFQSALPSQGNGSVPVASSNPSVQNLGPGQVPVVQPVPQIVTQQVAPVTYQDSSQDTTADTSISNEQAGTFSKPLQTAGLSAVPQQVTYKTHYAGTPGLVDPTLYAPVGGGAGVQQVLYENNVGQQQTVTEINGTPTTYVPPGFVRKGTAQEIAQQQQLDPQNMAQGGTVRGYAAGGQSQDLMLEAKHRIATMNGYNGPKTNASLDAFANASPNMTAKFGAIGVAVAKGGYMRKGFDEGGIVDNLSYTSGEATDGLTKEQLDGMMQGAVKQTMQPVQAPVDYIQPDAADFIPVDAGQAAPIAPYAEAATVGTVQQASQQATPTAQTVDFVPAYTQVQAETADLTAAQGQVAPEAQVTAAQQQTSAITDMQAAQGTATMVDAPAAREIQAGEVISGAADAEKAALFNEQIQAATATPSKQATVAGQLEGLMQQFEGGETPAWAAGSMRTAMATLSARGLGASSMAGQAVIQATMEAALPIAQMDAQVQAQFEGQNLSNRQQRAMLAAQQRATFLGMEFDQDFQARVQNSARIGDIANMNFTAEQNIAIENARAANTMNLSNLNNRQALVMAEAAALSQLDTQNLNNRQQAAVQNAQSFLQMDMANLSNEQQTSMFKSQQNIQALFTDQAAENAGKQFNASSQNQTDQYFANLRSQTSQFNASQQNAMDQFNVNSVNALREFNSEIQQQRDLFNAQNGLVIAQSNAQWRQNIATINSAAQNQSNSDFAKTMNALTSANMDQLWQRERDIMSYTFQQENNNADRATSIALQTLQNEASATTAAAEKSSAFATAAGTIISAMIP
jgi:hypothetical protein